jgi:hypothetical protein
MPTPELIYLNETHGGCGHMAPMSVRSILAERLLAHATTCQKAAGSCWDKTIAAELEKLAEDCRQAALACEPELLHHDASSRWKN